MNASLVFLFLALASSYLVIRLLATLVHECGHLLALRLAGVQGEKRIYLGSLGVSKRAWRVRVGRSVWLLHPRGLLMRGSLTDYDAPVSPNRLLWVTLAGPAASALMATTTASIALVEWSAGPVSLILLLAGVIASFDTILSLLHGYAPIPLTNARITANDGQMIGWWWRYRSDLDTYLHARWLFEKDQYGEAIDALQALINAGHREKLLYEYLMYAFLMMRRPQDALTLFAELQANHSLDAYDHCLHALAQDYLGNAEIVDQALEAAIALAPGHAEALNYRAFRAIEARQLDRAQADLDRAVRSNPEFAAALSNRGLVFLTRGDLVASRQDLELALRLDHENPYNHLHWALLMRQMGDGAGEEAALGRARLLGLAVHKGLENA